MYEPSTGRFNRLDPFSGNAQDPQSFHKYAYVHGDPIQGADPTGKFVSAGISLGALFGIFRQIAGVSFAAQVAANESTRERYPGNLAAGSFGMARIRTGQGWQPGGARIFFNPPTSSKSDEIGFVQIVKSTNLDTNSPAGWGGAQTTRRTNAGWAVDRSENQPSGWYGYNGFKPGGNFWPGRTGVTAIMSDIPTRRPEEPNLRVEFQTYAISKSGADRGTIYGGLSWEVVFRNGQPTVKNNGPIPRSTQEFRDAVQKWNQQARGELSTPQGIPEQYERNHPDQKPFER